MSFAGDADKAAALLSVTPGWSQLGIDDETARAVLDEAAKIAEGVIAPLNVNADREGCRVIDGRVITPGGFKTAYQQFANGGWIGFDVADEHGGQGLPLALQTACQHLFDRACPAFMMAPGATRAAAHLLSETAPDMVQGLIDGRNAATICISEPGAGSDVGRITTKAVRDADGWRVTGQKIWISFGDHDMADGIIHCLLARTSDAAGTRGLSLFAVPGDGVEVIRIEEKLGLHGSPTCALSFNNAKAQLLGTEGRGLPQLFTMIQLMRLQTGCQGLGIASGALDVARQYAAERKQGGDPTAPALSILTHIDVRRQLLEMESRTEILRAALLELAVAIDLGDDPAFVSWALPLIKTFGGETGFDVATAAIQVLGGAGYTKEFPVEQALRDSRVLTIYEGTTGMQAQDFLMRRLWKDKAAGLHALIRRSKAELSGNTAAKAVVDQFVALSDRMMTLQSEPRQGEVAADSYARAGWLALSAWMCARLSNAGYPHLATYRLHSMEEEMMVLAKRCQLPYASVDDHFI